MASRLKKLTKAFGFYDGLKFYWQIKRSRSGWFASDKYNARFFLRKDTTDYDTFEQVFLQKQYDVDVNFQPKFIIDGGANIGLAAIYFAQRFPAATIISIEPSKENFDLLQTNTASLKQVHCLQNGIWNKDVGLMITNITGDKNAFMVAEVPDETMHAIKAVSIDTIMQQAGINSIDILKLDIEGAEKELFAFNYANWLPKTKMIILELHDFMKKGASKSVFAAISKYDFSFSMMGENIILTNNALI